MAQAVQEHSVMQSSAALTQRTAPRQGDHERLFQLLEKDGPAPDEFMLHLSDPVIERENTFEDEDAS